MIGFVIPTVQPLALAQTSPPVTSPPATGQQEAPIPRYLAPSGAASGSQWERWDINAHLNGATPITPQLGAGTSFPSFNQVITVTAAPYNALGDARQAADGAINGGSSTFTSASIGFASGDVGKAISINGAGSAGAAFQATITGFVNSTTVTLSTPAATTVSSALFTYGTDNTTPIQNAINACPVDLVTGSGCQLHFPAGRYFVTGNLVVNRGTSGETGGIWLVGDGNWTSRIVGSNAISSGAILSFNHVQANPSGIVDLGIAAAYGGNFNIDCLDLVNSNGIYVVQDWFSSCNRNFYSSNTSSLWVHQDVSELGNSANYYFTGITTGRITNNESYGYHDASLIGFDFESISNLASGLRLVVDDNDEIGSGYLGLKINGCTGVDFGAFSQSAPLGSPSQSIAVANSSNLSIAPRVTNTAGLPIGIDSLSHDVTIESPQFSVGPQSNWSGIPLISTAAGSYNIHIEGPRNPNLLPDSGSFRSWSLTTPFAIGPGIGPNGENALTLAGTGSTQTVSTSSPQVAISPALAGSIVAFGGYLDATNVTTGGPLEIVLATSLNPAGIAVCSVPNGVKGRCWGTYALPATALSASMGSADTTATVASTSGFPASGTLLIDAEQISYSGTTSTSFTGLTRGANSTTAASHSSGAKVGAYITYLALSPYTSTGGVTIPSGKLAVFSEMKLEIAPYATGYLTGEQETPGTIAQSITDTGLTPGGCVQAGSGGLLTTPTGSGCGAILCAGQVHLTSGSGSLGCSAATSSSVVVCSDASGNSNPCGSGAPSGGAIPIYGSGSDTCSCVVH